MDLPKLFRNNRMIALGLRLATTSSLCLLALLGAVILSFPELSSDMKLLLTLFVVATSGVLFVLGRKSDAAARGEFEALQQVLQRLARGDCNARVPEGSSELGHLGELVNALATELITARELVEKRELQLKTSRANCNNSQLKNQVLAVVSQELQTTFDHVIELCVMLSHTRLDAEQQCITEHIQKACSALVDTLCKVSTFEALESNTITIAEEEFDLRSAIHATVARQSFRAEKKGVRVICSIDGSVPERCVGDGNRLGQVLSHFVDTAINHTEEGTITVSACIDEDGPTHVVMRVDVSDTGTATSRGPTVGILDSSPVREPVDSDSDAMLGLGLAVCRGLTEMMGGRVGTHTREGLGSTVWFTVRLGKCTAVSREANAVSIPCAPVTAGLPVLLVTPKPENAAPIIVTLHKAGFSANVALSRVQFLEALNNDVYGAVVVDGERPELIATVSAWTQIEDVAQVPVIGLPCREGSDGTKTVDLDQLRRSLGPLLNPDSVTVKSP